MQYPPPVSQLPFESLFRALFYRWLSLHSASRCGRPEAELTQDIQLSGTHILEEHCIFDNKDGEHKAMQSR